MNGKKLSLREWIGGLRPVTLLMSLASVGSGAACALWFAHSCAPDAACTFLGPEAFGGRWWALAFLALGVAVFLQLAANLVDDAADGMSGRDSTRSPQAPKRLVASGASPRRVLALATIFLLAGVACGVAACAIAGGSRWWLLVLGGMCVAAVWGYSAGPRPVSTGPWAPLLVILVFGFAGVLGTQFLLTADVSLGAIFAAFGQGCACTAVLLVNDIRDEADDARHGKRTLAVCLHGGARTVFTAFSLVGPIILLLQAIAMRAWLALVPALAALAIAVWNPVAHAQADGSNRRTFRISWTSALRIMCAVPPVLMIGLWLVAIRV